MMIGRLYYTTIIVAMIPPLWHKLMTPATRLDRESATDEERKLAARANVRVEFRACSRPLRLARLSLYRLKF